MNTRTDSPRRPPARYRNGRAHAFARAFGSDDESVARFAAIDGQDVVVHRKASFYPARLVAKRPREVRA
jgi:hypothetical protein